MRSCSLDMAGWSRVSAKGARCGAPGTGATLVGAQPASSGDPPVSADKKIRKKHICNTYKTGHLIARSVPPHGQTDGQTLETICVIIPRRRACSLTNKKKEKKGVKVYEFLKNASKGSGRNGDQLFVRHPFEEVKFPIN